MENYEKVSLSDSSRFFMKQKQTLSDIQFFFPVISPQVFVAPAAPLKRRCARTHRTLTANCPMMKTPRRNTVGTEPHSPLSSSTNWKELLKSPIIRTCTAGRSWPWRSTCRRSECRYNQFYSHQVLLIFLARILGLQACSTIAVINNCCNFSTSRHKHTKTSVMFAINTTTEEFLRNRYTQNDIE